MARNNGRGGAGVVHGKGVVAPARIGERARSNEEKDQEAEVSRRSRSRVYICLIGFGREATEAKEKQEGIRESEGIDREAAPGRIHSKLSGPLNRRSDGHEILERCDEAEHRPNQTALIYRDVDSDWHIPAPLCCLSTH